ACTAPRRDAGSVCLARSREWCVSPPRLRRTLRESNLRRTESCRGPKPKSLRRGNRSEMRKSLTKSVLMSAALLLASCMIVLAQSTTPSCDACQDRRDIRQDTKDVRSDRGDIHADSEDLRSDVRDYREERREGASQEELMADRREMRSDKIGRAHV